MHYKSPTIYSHPYVSLRYGCWDGPFRYDQAFKVGLHPTEPWLHWGPATARNVCEGHRPWSARFQFQIALVNHG